MILTIHSNLIALFKSILLYDSSAGGTFIKILLEYVVSLGLKC